MDALELDRAGYTGTYKLVGGRLALDFINTVSWPGTAREHDWLSSQANLAHWAAAVGFELEANGAADLGAIQELRSCLRAVISPIAHAGHPNRKVVEVFNKALSSAMGRRRIDPKTLQWSWIAPAAPVDCFGPVVIDAADLLSAGPRDRLKHCPSCDWLFEDQTRNGRRRWCDMADCGSRAKTRDYYYRRKAQK